MPATPKKKPVKSLSASGIVKALLARGMSTEEIAVNLLVTNISVLRWRDGRAAPHRAHLSHLEALLVRRQVKQQSK